MKTEKTISHTGLRRKINEDFSGQMHADKGSVYVVCDGMGGHAKGDIASQKACETFLNTYTKFLFSSINEALAKSIENANSKVYELSLQDEGSKGMGTTLVAAVIFENKLFYSHVGDSRLFLIRDGRLKQLTEDHSFVAELVNAKIITEQEAKIHPRKNEISRAIGIKPTVDPSNDNEPITLQKGDFILLCTDGLTNMVHEDSIRDIIASNEAVADKAQKLIDEANGAGGHDNITVTLIEVKTLEKIVTAKKRNWFFFFVFLVTIVVLIWSINATRAKEKVEKNEPITNSVNNNINIDQPRSSETTVAEKKFNNLPKKKEVSTISYDLSCMSGNEDDLMGFVNFMSYTRDEMVNTVTEQVSVQKEMEYGETVFSQLSEESDVVSNDRLNHILIKIQNNINDSKYTYRIFEIKDPTVNAFTVGGYIYIHSGMLSFVHSKDELAAVITHEINHNELGHINKKLRMNEAATSFIGEEAAEIAIALEGIATSSFNQKDETMCDLYGVDLMILSGYDPCAAIDLWSRMARNESISNVFDEMMRTHPYSSKRAVCIEHHLLSNYRFECN